MSVSPESFAHVCALVRRRSAIVLESGKEYLVDARLGPVAKDAGFASIDDLVAHVRRIEAGREHEELARSIVEAMTTTETSFFRDVHPFSILETKVLPELVQARARRRALRIWCAAASTGQEPFSVAMLLCEHFPQLASWDVRIFATDINRAVLDRARSGVFRQLEINRGLPVRMLVKYFDRRGLDWQIKPEIRRMVSFQELNLLERWPLFGRQDVVLMRNVLIYFDVPTKKQILGRVREVMAEDGVLFLGGTETTMNLEDSLVGERLAGPGVLFRAKGAAGRPGETKTG
ncbi:MAG: protein-glutamate O-methyltransferase CheR [Labilithrix sp.]|nr:protein-glutamate O-methyltransferase CheR [Labilithrix sp.]MCW5835483.1 protein-glutamate O-methyltransferase CheR [Labilithrix sp.]